MPPSRPQSAQRNEQAEERQTLGKDSDLFAARERR
jgi:hypothetical protein